METLLFLGILFLICTNGGKSIGALKKTAWTNPYENGKPTLKHSYYKNKSGVYFIKSEKTGEIYYIGYSGNNIYRTLYHHFNEWNDKELQRAGKERRTYAKTGYKIRLILCTPLQASRLEKYLIDKMKPKHNKLQYELTLNETDEQKAQTDWNNKNLTDIVFSNQPGEEVEYPF